MKKTLFFALLFAATIALTAQEIAVLTIHKWDFVTFFKREKNMVAYGIEKLVSDKKLKIYANKGLVKELTQQEFAAKGSVGKRITIISPDNPEDVTDLIDTVIYEGYNYTQVPGFGLPGNNVLEYTLPNGNTVFFRLNEVLQLLPPNEAGFINWLVAKNITLFNYDTWETLAANEFYELKKQVYKTPFTNNGAVLAYKNEKLDAAFTQQNLFNVCSFANKENDATLADIMPVDSIVEIHLLETVARTNNRFEYTGKTIALCPVALSQSKSEFLPPTELFWLKIENVEPLFTAQQRWLYEQVFYYNHLRHIDDIRDYLANDM
jgi:hypothetical protein